MYTGTRDMIKSINAEEMMRKQLKTLYRNNTNECVIEAMKFEDEEKKKEKLKFDSCYRTMSPLEICRDLYSDYYSLIMSYTNEHMRIKIMYKISKELKSIMTSIQVQVMRKRMRMMMRKILGVIMRMIKLLH